VSDKARPPAPAPDESSGRIRIDDEEVVVGTPAPKNELEEVEQALSLLDGRHHDTVRVQRENHQAAAAKRASYEAEAHAAASRHSRAMALRIFAGLLLVGAAATGGFYGYRFYEHAVTVDGALKSRAAPFVAGGWSALPRSMWHPRSREEVSVGGDTCILAVATAPLGKLTIERWSGSLSAEGSVAWCSCGDEHAVVQSLDPSAGVQILTQQARAVGGNLALPFLSPKPETLPAVEACQIDPLDTWLAAGRGISTPSDGQVAPTTRDGLKTRGFSLVASAPTGLPFAVVPAAADSCFIATSSIPGEELSLRVALGQRPMHIAPGTSLAIGWCTHLPLASTVFRTGKGDIAVYRANAGPLPGTFGLREAAARAGLGDVPTWVSRGERGWDASAPLLMSGILANDIATPTDARPLTKARVIGLTLQGGHVTPTPDEIDRYTCGPALDGHARGAVCVQSSPLGWFTAAGEPAGIAESPLPFWMDILTNVDGTPGLTLELQLLTLSRRLAREGYEPTARGGVTEDRDGVLIEGRPGDDRIIAVGMMRVAPWVLPYTDAAPWTLDGDPHSVALAAGQEVHLTVRPWPRIPADSRRTVVFRHRAQP